jgi:hypothetical protein
MSSAFRRQYPRERVEQRDAALHWCLKLVDQFGEDAWLVIQNKHKELHGASFYSIGQIEEVNAIIAAYTPDELDTAVALAKSRESAV